VWTACVCLCGAVTSLSPRSVSTPSPLELSVPAHTPSTPRPHLLPPSPPQTYLALNEQRNFISDVAAAVGAAPPPSAEPPLAAPAAGPGLAAIMARLRAALETPPRSSSSPQSPPPPPPLDRRQQQQQRNDGPAPAGVSSDADEGSLSVERLRSILGAKDLAQVREDDVTGGGTWEGGRGQGEGTGDGLLIGIRRGGSERCCCCFY